MSNTVIFGVYDEKTDELLTPYDVAKRSYPGCEWLRLTVNGFAIDWDGLLWVTTENDRIYRIPKEGKYLIKFVDSGEFMKW